MSFDDDDELLGFDDDNFPRPMTLANAIQVYALRQTHRPVTVAECALTFMVTEAQARHAIEQHPWMFTTGANDEFVEHEGE